jgi:hypothetical protein
MGSQATIDPGAGESGISGPHGGLDTARRGHPLQCWETEPLEVLQSLGRVSGVSGVCPDCPLRQVVDRVGKDAERVATLARYR